MMSNISFNTDALRHPAAARLTTASRRLPLRYVAKGHSFSAFASTRVGDVDGQPQAPSPQLRQFRTSRCTGSV
jgi:hypothetical protein